MILRVVVVQAAREAEESARRAEEARKREEERLTREYAEEEAEEVRKMMREKGIVVKDGETLDKRALMQREFERKAKELNEFEAKMNKIARNMDYLERARREEELPYLEEAMKKRAAEQKEYFEAEQVSALKLHKEKWVADVDAKHRSAHLSEDKCAPLRFVTELHVLQYWFHLYSVCARMLGVIVHSRNHTQELRGVLGWRSETQ